MKIAILGGGNSGFSVGAFFADKGHKVSIYKRSLGSNEAIYDYKVKVKGIISFESVIDILTNNMELAMEGAEIVFTTIPGYCQKLFFEEYINHLNTNIYTVLMPDNYGSFYLDNIFKANGIMDYKKILSLNSALFASRKKNEFFVDIKGIKKEILVSSIYEETTKEGLDILNNIYPVFMSGDNIFEICMSNMNPIVHTATTLMNAGWIEKTSGNFDFYGDGITPAVARVIERVDTERVELGRGVGLELHSLLLNMQRVYDSKGDNIYSALSGSNIHSKDLAPCSLQTRYIEEDIPYGLIPLSKLGKILKIKTEAIDTLISLGTIASGKNFEEESIKYFEDFAATFLYNRL
jgi:opine dehydrogenase